MWYVPDFKGLRLLSVQSLVKDGYEVSFRGNQAFCTKDNNLIFHSLWDNGSYIVNDATAFTANRGESEWEPQPLPNPEPESELDPDEPEPAFVNTDESSMHLIHRRLGHTNYKFIEKLSNHSISCKTRPKTTPASRQACTSCLAGKLKESFNKHTDTRRPKPGARIHSDTSGILPQSVQGFRYFLLVIDDATRMTWISLLQNKKETTCFSALSEIITEIGTALNSKITDVRYDNGKGEFGLLFQAKLREKDMRFEPCPPYKHSMNGVAEKYMDLVKMFTRSMLYQAQLLIKF